MPTGRTRAHWWRWWPFALLVLAGASRWMLEGARPEAGSTLGSKALGCTWAALLLLILSRRDRPRGDVSAKLRSALDWRALLAGALLLGGPASALLIGGELDAGDMAIALALTPVAVVIAAAALRRAAADGVPGRIWPALAAVAGLLLLVAEPSLRDARDDAAMLLAPALTGVGAALFCLEPVRPGEARRPGDGSRPCTAALAGGAALFAMALGLWWLVVGHRPVVALAAVACDGLVALLAVVALERVGATRWSAQFALLPLLVLLEGVVLVRPGVTGRWIAGLGLLALASVYLLLPPVDEPERGPAFVPR